MPFYKLMLNGNMNKTYFNHYNKVLVSLICKELSKINEKNGSNPKKTKKNDDAQTPIGKKKVVLRKDIHL